MAKDFESLKQQALVIKNEVEDGANSSERIGGILEDILDYNEEKRKELEEKIGSQTVEVDTELNEESQKPIANAPVTKGINKLKEQISTQLPAIEEAKENAIAEIGNKESDAIQNFSEQRVTPGMLSPETIQIINASGGGTINNLPDGETLAEIEMAEGLKAIGIPNRQPDTNLGYVILKKNKSLIEQITDANTIYEVRYAYDLGGETLTMPENCVLKFEGGLITNGKIVGNYTKIDALPCSVFSETVTMDGSFDGIYIYAEWFGAKSLYSKSTASTEYVQFKEVSIPKEIYNIPDAAPAINKALYLSYLGGGEVEMLSRIYHIKSTVEIVFRSVLHTQNDTLFVVNMNGVATTKVQHNEDDASMKDISSDDSFYTLSRNEFIKTDSMAVAFNVHPVKTKLYGGGSITLYPSRYTIGVRIYSIGYWYMDMTYYTPIIDIVICGEKKNISSPDPRDYVGNGEPTDDIGSGNTDTIYYWDKQNKKYYSRNVGGKWGLINSEADPHWNTCMRIEVSTGSSGGRIINPHINCRMIYGARGLEVVIRDSTGSSWFNESWIEGSITEMYSNYISVFCEKNLSCDAHDWQKLLVQSSNKGMYDSAMFYAIRSGGIKLGHFWDVTWLASKQKENYYLGKQTKGVTLTWVDGNVKDLGQENNWGQKIFTYSDKSPLLETMWRNIWDKYIPSGKIYGGILDSLLTEENINTTFLKNKVDGQTPCKYIFDSDLATYSRIIDVSNNKFGFYLNCYPSYNNSIEKMTRYNYVLAIKYIYRGDSENWGKLKCKILGEHPTTSKFNLDVNLNKGISYNQIGINMLTDTTFINIPYNNVKDLQILIYIEEEVNFTFDLVSLELWIDSLGDTYSDVVNINKTLPTAPPKGVICLVGEEECLVNIGDAESPQWVNLIKKDYIEFKDKEVERICLENWSEDGIGLTKKMASKIKTLSKKFKNNDVIENFDEFEFFNGIGGTLKGSYQSSEDFFTGCSNLKNIKLPNSIIKISDGSNSYGGGNAAFLNCSSLQSIDLKEVVYIGAYAFYGCNILSDIGECKPIYIGEGCFYGTALNKIDLSSVETIGGKAFQNTPLQIEINAPSLTGVLSNNAFHGCGILGIESLGNITEISDGNWGEYNIYGVFSRCTSLSYVNLPATITKIGANSFRECNNLVKIKIEAIVPPTLGSNAFLSTNAELKIYVPDDSIESYKTSENWTTYSDIIYPVSDYVD